MSKYFTTTLRGLALLSLAFGLAAALLASPSSAVAATCNPIGVGPQACVAVSVHVYDRMNGNPIDDAKVDLIDAYGNVTPAYDLTGVGGLYSANVTPGKYRVVVAAPAYFNYSATIMVLTEPVTTSAPLVPATFN
jgi:5-hydroxyisourate hydrolase-like protein (transthyretin family)